MSKMSKAISQKSKKPLLKTRAFQITRPNLQEQRSGQATVTRILPKKNAR